MSFERSRKTIVKRESELILERYDTALEMVYKEKEEEEEEEEEECLHTSMAAVTN